MRKAVKRSSLLSRSHYQERKPTGFWLKAPVVKGFCIYPGKRAENGFL